ncbi:hypothetical protein [Thermococcus sp. Bubb.Bath]|uniref:hypothetical protein n=1 Tax=Thermococcus sp. Bubb.Bath TaxID=1638242 RepID=UPI00143C49AE|nr:hypothetical protein [Thermococcus sp. Bubb.Bath]NJF24398.1 hypothetical protein [Thermococcus sp. Bubb.Bath]
MSSGTTAEEDPYWWRDIGFIYLLIASIYFLNETFSSDSKVNMVEGIGLVLLLFAWTDFRDFVIFPIFAISAFIGFFVGNYGRIIYSFLVAIFFVAFSLLLGANKEKEATYVFLAALPVAVLSSYYMPGGSALDWSLIGLMLGYIENTVIEEMAEGDVYIIALYFMALGPLAFIPYGLQVITGTALYSEEIRYPVGPAMFLPATPLFLWLPKLTSSRLIPSWLFYPQVHGLTHPSAAFAVALISIFIVAGAEYYIKVSNLLAVISGFFAFVVTLLASLTVFVLVNKLLTGKFSGEPSTWVALFIVFVSFVVGADVAMYSSNLHYEGKSSIDVTPFCLGALIFGIILTVLVLAAALDVKLLDRKAVIVSLLSSALMFILTKYTMGPSKGEPIDAVTGISLVGSIFAGFLAGVPLSILF